MCPDLVRVAELGRGRARGAGICLTAVLGRSLLGSASFLPEEGFNLDNISLLFFSVAASRSLLEKGLDLPDRQKLVLSLSMLSAPCSAAGRELRSVQTRQGEGGAVLGQYRGGGVNSRGNGTKYRIIELNQIKWSN